MCCHTDVQHIDWLIFLPKKAFNSFCTWMLLPTVRYTPSCVAPKMKMGVGEGCRREEEIKGSTIRTNGEVWKCTTGRLPECGQRCKRSCLILSLWTGAVVSQAAILWAKRECAELEKRVPAVEFMAVVIDCNIPPFISLAWATTGTLFYRNVRLKRTKLAPTWSFVKSQFDR